MMEDGNQLSFAKSLLSKSEKEENIYKAMNIFSELLCSKSETPSVVTGILFDCFSIANNKTRIALLFLIHKYKETIEKDYYLKNKMNDLIKKVIEIITRSDIIARKCAIELLVELPFIMNLELLHMIFDLYDKHKEDIDERDLIEKLFNEIINKDLIYKRNVVTFLNNNQITLTQSD